MPAPATSASPPGHALVLTDLFAGYQDVSVVRELNLEVRPGEVVALLGPNGAGKTTTLETIAGLHRPISGTVELSGHSVGGKPAHTLAHRGLALVPEGRALFPGLTVREHLRLAGGQRASREEELLEMLPELRKCLNRKAGLLSGGEQQMLAVGRALVTRPRLLLVDEMSLGLAPVIVERLLPILRRGGPAAVRRGAVPASWPAACCSSSSTSRWRWRSPTAPTSWPTAGSGSRALPPSSAGGVSCSPPAISGRRPPERADFPAIPHHRYIPSPKEAQMKPLRLLSVTGAAVLVLTAAACSSSGSSGSSAPSSGSTTPSSGITTAAASSVFGTPKKATGSPYVFGMINDETGAVTFPEARQGAIAAVDYVNNYLDGINGHPIVINECTGDGTPATAARCANQLVAAHPLAIRGAAAVGAPASIPIYAHANLAYLGGIPFTPVPETASNSIQFWSVSVGDNAAAAVYAGKTLGLKSVALIYFSNAQGESIIPQITPVFKAAGVTTIHLIPLSPTSPDPSPQAGLVESSGD